MWQAIIRIDAFYLESNIFISDHWHDFANADSYDTFNPVCLRVRNAAGFCKHVRTSISRRDQCLLSPCLIPTVSQKMTWLWMYALSSRMGRLGGFRVEAGRLVPRGPSARRRCLAYHGGEWVEL